MRYCTLFICFALYLVLPALSFADDRLPVPYPNKLLQAQKFSQAAPVVFLENKGQITDEHGKVRSDIQFRIPVRNINIFVAPGVLHYQWTKQVGVPADNLIDIYRMDAVLEGANPHAAVIKEDKEEYYEQYYLPQCPDGIKAGSFSRITYKDVYPGIDWVLYNNEGHLKYDFVVHPGADPRQISIKYKGATGYRVEHDGDINVKTPFGEITEQKLLCYNAETKEVIPATAKFDDNGTLKFDIGNYTGTLVIDPQLEWATYYGGNSSEGGYTVVSDTSGGAYVGGITNSQVNIATTTSVYQTTYGGGNNDAYLVRFSKSGQRLWATYYGGTENDFFFSSSIDTSGYIYLAGITKSTGMASNSAHQNTFGGGNSDCLLVKFNPNGGREWATYYGGNGDESAPQVEYQVWVACDKQNSVYIGGNTTSTGTGVIATSGTYQTTISSGKDGFLARFNTAGVRQWGTYYGSNADDKIVKIVFDQVDNVYIAGETKSTGTDLATTNGHQTSFGGGTTDAFLAKFLQNGQRAWGTYYGGNGTDGPEGLAADVYGYIYLSGSASSTNNIATPGSSQPNLSGSTQDCFLVKFDTAGVRQWGTYFGGPAVDHCGDMTMDNFGNICFTGYTGNDEGITTRDAYQPIFGGATDAFLAIFTLSGFKYWVSYLGGSASDYGYGLKYSNRGDLYLVGTTYSTNNIATANTYQTSLSGQNDAFLAKFQADTSTFIIPPFTVSNICAGDTFSVNYGITNPFKSGNKFYVQLSNATGSFANPDTIGVLASTDVGRIHCKVPITTQGGSGYRVRVVSSLPKSTSLENISGITIRLLPVKPVADNNSPICSSVDTLKLTSSSTTPGVNYKWTGPNSFSSSHADTFIAAPATNATGNYVITAELDGCATKDTTSAVVNLTPSITGVTSNAPLCSDATLQLGVTTGTPGVTFAWTGPDTFSSADQNAKRYKMKTSGTGYYKIVLALSACTKADSVFVQVNPTFTPAVSIQVTPDDTICIGDSLTFSSTATGGGPSPVFQWQRNGSDITGANTTSWGSSAFTNNDKIRLVYIASGPCLSKPADTSAPVTITVQSAIVPSVTINAVPGTTAPENTLLMFTANPVNGGAAPEYQWLKNGAEIPGAISDVLPQYTTADLATGDIICVRIRSSLSCAEPDTASSCEQPIEVTTGIGKIAGSGQLKLFPNPNDGYFTLKGFINFNKELKIDIINALGQTIYTGGAIPVNKELNTSISLGSDIANGVYLLRLSTEHGTEMIRFTLSR